LNATVDVLSETRNSRAEAGSRCTVRAHPARQDLPPGCLAGERVRARASNWTIDRAERHGRCTALELRGARGRLTLLHPFDRPSPLRPAPWTRAPLSRAAGAALDALLQGSPLVALEGGAAPLALPSWQLAPARAFTSGLASRVLLADAVGLGKTIQAGLAIAALRAHGSLAHALVLAPAGLRDQWVAELDARLGLHAWTADPSACRAAEATLPPGVSAWLAHPLVVTSIDYAKQPDVLAAAAAIPWDLLVVDEAHNAGAGSDRRLAADALAARAARVLLVTATPHAGDDRAFDALCAIGARTADDEPPFVIRRTREDAGLPPGGRLRVVHVPRSADERAVHDALAAYATLVVRERRAGAPLAMAFLMKRAASSPEALRRSVERRRALLASAGEAPADPWLPFDDDVDERDDRDEPRPAALACPGLGSLDRELRLLDDLHGRASRACHAWSKGDRLSRWLSAPREPVVVFTEYRATLEALVGALPASVPVAVLHGGLGRAARAAALARFLDGDARALLATDVAGEGLNLQSRARTVVSIEMPWTPSRLRQRIGRVDRIGQRWPVRAACLASRGGPEARVATLVAERMARTRAALPDRDDMLDELQVLDAALGRSETPLHRACQESACPPPPNVPPGVSDETAAHAWLLRAAARRAGRLGPHVASPAIPWARLRPRGADDPLLGAVVVVFVAQSLAASGRPVAQAAVALVARIAREARTVPPVRLLRALAERLGPHAARAAAAPLAAARLAFERRTRAEIARMASDRRAERGRPVQAGLFDRRALTEAAQREAVRRARRADAAERTARLEDELADVSSAPPTPAAAFLCW
jgi:superfamily II DNA or RNA helicase